MSALHIFLSVFGVIFVAELPDKTALAALVLATRHKPWPVFLGTALALTVQSLVAVLAGGLLSLLPARPVHIGAGLLFLVSAVFMWRRKAEEPDDAHAKTLAVAPTFGRALATSFGVVFIAEWGDLTQLGTAALAARYHEPVLVFSAATLALWAVAGLAVFVGNRAGKFLDAALTKRIASAVFAVLGTALLVGVV
ncbi:TMEM165/GDT1 family protein [Pendulispora rubella]|uniref:GDT1 family protein n=1 Tax=Pendulispora rubella TaxID=2741070 RepID=A0ABZ2KT50_9BACT